MAEAREVADRYTDLINAHDPEALAALYAEDGVLSDSTGEYRGPEAIAQYWRGFFQAFSDVAGEDVFTAESGDTAISEWTTSGTHDGPLETPFGTIPASGRRALLPAVQVTRIKDGMIQEVRHVFDLMGLVSQLGVSYDAPAAGFHPAARGA